MVASLELGFRGDDRPTKIHEQVLPTKQNQITLVGDAAWGGKKLKISLVSF